VAFCINTKLHQRNQKLGATLGNRAKGNIHFTDGVPAQHQPSPTTSRHSHFYMGGMSSLNHIHRRHFYNNIGGNTMLSSTLGVVSLVAITFVILQACA
jgi:hypothetical protein